MGNSAGAFFVVYGTRMDIPYFFAGSMAATKITAGVGGLVITGLSATGGTAILVGAGVFVGIAVVSTGVVYVLVKNYDESKKKNM